MCGLGGVAGLRALSVKPQILCSQHPTAQVREQPGSFYTMPREYAELLEQLLDGQKLGARGIERLFKLYILIMGTFSNVAQISKGFRFPVDSRESGLRFLASLV